jgi:hypothetical protein
LFHNIILKEYRLQYLEEAKRISVGIFTSRCEFFQLKGLSHKKVAEIKPWGIGIGPNQEPQMVLKIF